MIYLFDLFITIILFLFFAIFHTILASNKIKIIISKKIGEKIAFYRLFYNMLSILILLLIWGISPKPDIVIYDLEYPFDILIFVLQILSGVGILWSISKIDLGELSGFNQVKRYLKKNYDIQVLDGKIQLKFDGPYKLCRHPIYFFSILFLGLRPTMDLFYLVIFICIVIYLIIGSYSEEKKIIDKHGYRYEKYQRRVPRIIPGFYKFKVLWK
ncbi:methyltransferase family protein [Bacteroidota bacterium]